MSKEGSGVESISDVVGYGGSVSVIVGRESLNANRMTETMRWAREGSRMVMKDTFSSVILIEGKAQEERVDEMRSCVMEALVRVSSTKISIGVDFSGVLNWL
jgi:hypothetical protein